jgi:hypothetical protein
MGESAKVVVLLYMGRILNNFACRAGWASAAGYYYVVIEGGSIRAEQGSSA